MTPLRVALVGCGYITQAEHVPALLALQPEVAVVATVDTEVGRADAIARLFHAEKYGTLTEALGTSRFDAVLLCTPAPTHAGLIAEAAAAGKDIFVEKPIAYSLQEAREAIAAVERAGVRCMVAYHRRYDDDCVQVSRMLREGAIGEVRAAVSLCRLAFPSFYRTYAAMGPRPARRADQDLPADWLTENSIHHINLLRFWLGDPVRVHSASYRRRDHNLGIVTLEFPGGVLASHHQLRGMECGEEITVYGTRGNLRVELWYPHRPYRFPRLTHFTLEPPRWQEIVVARTSPYTNEMAHFVKYLRGEVEMWSGLADSYRDLEVLSDILDKAVYVDAGSAESEEKR
jgi:myo-inositol 2-dehydrogenase/D-chiro-inositol 1-dehydrogenase